MTEQIREGKKSFITFMKDNPSAPVVIIGQSALILLAIFQIIGSNVFYFSSGIVWILCYWLATKQKQNPISIKTFLIFAIVEIIFIIWDIT